MNPINSASFLASLLQPSEIDVTAETASELPDPNFLFKRVENGVTEQVDAQDVARVNTALITLGDFDSGNEAVDAALDNLVTSDSLDDLVKEMYGTGIGDAMAADTRATIITNIATHADGETLAGFAQALESSTNAVDGNERTQELAQAISTHAPAQVRVDFIQALAIESTQARSIDSTSEDSSIAISGDTKAAAVTTVLESLDGVFAQEALTALFPQHLDTVVNSSIKEQSIT